MLLSGGFRSGCRLQEALFAVDEIDDVIGGDFELMAVRDGIGRTGLDTVTAENTTVVVDVIDLSVTFTRANPLVGGIITGLDVDTMGRAGGGTQEASHALLQPVFVSTQNVQAPKASFEMDRLVGVILRYGRPQHGLEGYREALGER